MNTKSVLVVGAGGVLGLEIVKALTGRGLTVTGAYRRQRDGVCAAIEQAGATPLRLDIEDSEAMRRALEAVDAAVFTPILTISAKAAPLLRPDQQAVFFSSNNVAIDPEARIYAALRASEQEVRQTAPQAVILRPTMIYGHPGDGNLARLMSAMRKRPLIPMPATSSALQQPIFLKDLAEMAVRALSDPAFYGSTRAAAGPVPVTTKALYEAVSKASGARPVFAPLPTSLLAWVVGGIEKAGLRLPFSAAQLARAGRDKLPAEPVLLGETPLSAGLEALAAQMAYTGGALDGSQAGA